jgi:hypothetical protein
MDFYKRDIIFTGDEKKDLKIPKFKIFSLKEKASTRVSAFIHPSLSFCISLTPSKDVARLTLL